MTTLSHPNRPLPTLHRPLSPHSPSSSQTCSASPSPASSSYLSRGTSVDDLNDITIIDKYRAPWDKSLETQMGQTGLVEKKGESSRMGSRAASPTGKAMDGGEAEKKEIRRHPEEADEPILRESASRFVLFPIKYREVRNGHSTKLCQWPSS
jgi:ribonucleoside-diphosphate reductase subunit M2